MANWIVTITEKYPEHWEFAMKDGFWDLTKRKDITAGDDVFFWQSGGKGLVGWTRVTKGIRQIDEDASPARWQDADSGKYRTRFNFELISDEVKTGLAWKDIKEKTGITQLLRNGQIKVPEGYAADYLRDLFATSGTDNDLDAADDQVPFAVDPDEDVRTTAQRTIKTRRGQPKFRNSLLDAYDRTCAITGCTAVSALEAAHIMPYRGDATNDVRNGLLLRADIHTLFDLFLITVDEDWTVRISPELETTGYEEYSG